MAELLSHRNLQNVVKELNTKFKSKLKPITTREIFISQILDTIGNFTEEQQDLLSSDAKDVYNALIALPPTPTNVEDLEDTCPAYGVAYDGNDSECQACDKPEECQELTLKNAAVKSGAKKEKPVEKEREKEQKKERKLSRYGQQVGTMGATIDELLWNGGKGSSLTEIVQAVMENHDRTEVAAVAKIKAHTARLKKDGMPIVKEDDLYRAEVETFSK